MNGWMRLAAALVTFSVGTALAEEAWAFATPVKAVVATDSRVILIGENSARTMRKPSSVTQQRYQPPAVQSNQPRASGTVSPKPRPVPPQIYQQPRVEQNFGTTTYTTRQMKGPQPYQKPQVEQNWGTTSEPQYQMIDPEPQQQPQAEQNWNAQPASGPAAGSVDLLGILSSPSGQPPASGSLPALPSASTGGAASGPVGGWAAVLNTGTLQVGHKIVRLVGVQGEPGKYAAELQRYLDQRSVQCLPVGATLYRCEVGGRDLSQIVLIRGGGRATADAPPHLKAAESSARSAGRGLWSTVGAGG